MSQLIQELQPINFLLKKNALRFKMFEYRQTATCSSEIPCQNQGSFLK